MSAGPEQRSDGTRDYQNSFTTYNLSPPSWGAARGAPIAARSGKSTEGERVKAGAAEPVELCACLAQALRGSACARRRGACARRRGARRIGLAGYRWFLNQILPLQKCTRGAGSVRGAGGCKRCTAWCHPPQQYWSQLTWAATGAIAPAPGLSMADICPMPRHP